MMGWLTVGLMLLAASNTAPASPGATWIPPDFRLMNVAPAPAPAFPATETPIVVQPFEEHVRGAVISAPDSVTGISVAADGTLQTNSATPPTLDDGTIIRGELAAQGKTWRATDRGLYFLNPGDKTWTYHAAYGEGGPLATRITGLVKDSRDVLWLGTPLGLSMRLPDGAWRHLRGVDGLPVESVTALAMDGRDNLWIGTTRGAVLYRPYAEGRQWYYRAGRRYLPGDQVRAVALAPEGMPAYFLTDGGVGRLDAVTTTLLEKARTIEKLVNERHRRLGLVADCLLDNADNPTSHVIHDNDNDGLWTAYHVAAMSLCYAVTKEDAAKESAKTSMHALYMLENISGVPGLVARSVLPPELGQAKDKTKEKGKWRPTADGTMYWKSDTSSDEIDGHFLAFYTYFEHIAKDDAAEQAVLDKQVRALTDHLVDNGYQLIDWDGKRTRWGFWDPKSLNDTSAHAVENGLNSLQMLSFLKVAYYITGDKKYDKHYRSLILDHGYLNNILYTKKSFPDENNHSDDQLGYVAWYPILQLEQDKVIKRVLTTGVKRHYEVVRPERPSFYAFVTGTAAPGVVDFVAAADTLREIPTDRRCWKMDNSHRADVSFREHPNRFGQRVLTRVLPADERAFMKWNRDPYLPDGGGTARHDDADAAHVPNDRDGRREDDGAAYLLPYWMGRYHGFIAEP